MCIFTDEIKNANQQITNITNFKRLKHEKIYSFFNIVCLDWLNSQG